MPVPEAVSERAVEFAAECRSVFAASASDTVYADTGEEVVAAELDVIGELVELTDSWDLSPLEACRALFNPISERTGS